MRASVIRKSVSDLQPPPHFADYDAERRRFSWDANREKLGLRPGGLVNIASSAVDRHLATPTRERVAFRFIGRDDRQRDLSYAEFARLTSRFANVLRGPGIGKGDHVFLLAGRIPELYVAALGSLKNGR